MHGTNIVDTFAQAHLFSPIHRAANELATPVYKFELSVRLSESHQSEKKNLAVVSF